MENILANNIKYLREKSNLNQEDLAIKLNLKSYSTVGKWENEKSTPTLEMVKKIAILFNVDFKELIDVDLSKPKTYAPIEDDEIIEIPITLLGNASCGDGCFNDDTIVEYITLPKAWATKGMLGCYAVGNSMIGAGIIDNSIVLFDPQQTIENNEIGIFHLNGEEYIKRFRNIGGVIILKSENVGFNDIEVNEDDNFYVIGKVTKIVTNIN